ncbi:hypothetical protein [Flavobacterium sp. GCM10023249]|uniref:hypothetical protein n=1 Tax=unclassified Flavobacterium TaxID=196869 RepID=UPI003607C427
MKIAHLFLVLLAVCSAAGQKKETISIPEGIVYHYCDPDKIELAKQRIQECLSGNGSALLQDHLIVGPVLWMRFKDHPEIQKIEEGKVTFHVNDLEIEGKMCQSVKDSEIIWNALRKEIAGDFQIRKATPSELQYYWSVISFEIEEPLLIVETQHHNYILNLLPNDLKLMWLDEAPWKASTQAKKEHIYQNGVEISAVPKGKKETKLEKVILLSSDEVLLENTSVEDLNRIMAKINTIFEDLFLKSNKSGKIIVEFDMGKTHNDILFAVKDDLDLKLMKKFEKRVMNETYPFSKNDPIKFQLLFKINAFNETE